MGAAYITTLLQEYAAGGEEAWKAFLANPPDLVLTDWHMPLMDGLELTRKILALPKLRVSAFTARVPALNAHSESVWVELDGDPPVPLRHNQMARLAVTIDAPAPVLAVPVGAVVRDGSRTYVFVRAGDTFDRRDVTLGRTDDRFAEVKAGLAAGEPVAVAGVEELNTAWQSVR